MVKDLQRLKGWTLSYSDFLFHPFQLTQWFVVFSFEHRLNYKGDFKTTPTLVTGDGDGTVNARSLKSCEKWSGTKAQRENTIHSIELPGADHMGILSDKRVLKYVLDVLINKK